MDNNKPDLTQNISDYKNMSNSSNHSPFIRNTDFVLTLLLFILIFLPLLLGPTLASDEEMLYRKTSRTVVIQLSSTGGGLAEIVDKTMVPDFTLYGDGRLIFKKVDELGNSCLMETKVTPEYIEFLINFIEKEGFFDMNENFLNVSVQDLPTTEFTVNLRKTSKTIKVYGFEVASHQGQLPRGLMNIYRKLTEYTSEDEKPYVPAKISLFVREVPGNAIPEDMKTEAWKAKGIDLRKYITEENTLVIKYKESVLEGDLCKDALGFLGGKTLYENRAGFFKTFFKNHKRYFMVAYRPHLPFE